AANREAVDAGDDRLLEAVDRFVHLQRRQNAGIKDGFLHAFLAPANAEELIAGACYHDHPRPCFTAGGSDAVANFVAHLDGEHVAVIRSVQRDCADRAILLVDDCIEAHESFLRMIFWSINFCRSSSLNPSSLPPGVAMSRREIWVCVSTLRSPFDKD